MAMKIVGVQYGNFDKIVGSKQIKRS